MLQNWLQSEPKLQRKQLNGPQEYRWLIKQGRIIWFSARNIGL